MYQQQQQQLAQSVAFGNVIKQDGESAQRGDPKPVNQVDTEEEEDMYDAEEEARE